MAPMIALAAADARGAAARPARTAAAAARTASAPPRRGRAAAPPPARAPWAALLAARTLRHRAASCAAAASSSDAASADAGAAGEERRLARALLLGFIASQNRCALGARALVEALVEAHRRGYSLNEVKVLLTISTLGTVDPLLQDVLVAWASVVLVTLRVAGVPPRAEGAARAAARAAAGAAGSGDGAAGGAPPGLEAFARGCVERFLGGQDLARLLMQQSVGGLGAAPPGGDAEAAGPSPAVAVLQQNTRLAILTLEMVRDAGLPTEIALPQRASLSVDEEEDVEAAAGAALLVAAGADGAAAAAASAAPAAAARLLPGGPGFVDGFLAAAGAPPPPRAEAARRAAVRLLVAFIGAALCWPASAWAFAEEASAAYAAGLPAEELFSALRPDDFAASGGVGPGLGVARLPGGQNVAAAIFGRYLSVAYMALAQLGAPFPGARESEGWAWVPALGNAGAGGDSDGVSGGAEGGALEAYGLAAFVSATLARLEAERGARAAQSGSDGEGGADGGGGPGSADDAPLVGFAGGLPDPDQAGTSPGVLLMQQQASLVAMVGELHAREEAAATAAAFQ
jgi:hypothetical protein